MTLMTGLPNANARARRVSFLPEAPKLCHSRPSETDMFVPMGLVNPARISRNLLDMTLPRMVEDATFAEVGGSTTERRGARRHLRN